MENLARSEYDFDADKKVKEELQIAGIPVIRLGVIILELMVIVAIHSLQNGQEIKMQTNYISHILISGKIKR